MVKSHLLFIIAVISGFLLTLQLITLQVIVRRSKPEANPTWRSLYAISSVASANDVPLFLIDPNILQLIAEKRQAPTSDPYCRVLCVSQKVTHLATLGQYATHLHLSRLSQALRDKGFTVFEFNDLDPSLLHHNLRISIPLHLLIFDEKLDKIDGHVAHLVVFHERVSSGQDWWQGELDLTEYEQRLVHRQGVRKPQFKISHRSSIYAKVELKATIIDGLILSLPADPSPFLQHQEAVRFIECNKTRAKEFYAVHGFDDSDAANIFRTKARRLLVKVKELLDELGVRFWLSSGTCLGYYRECDFIPYGQDLDIGIWINDYKSEIIDTFSMHDIPLLHVFGKTEDSFELSFRDSDIKLDIFFFYEEDDYVWNGGTQARTGLKFQYRFPRFKLCWTEFLEMRVRVPCETQAYIEANYGLNWSQPVKQWDWKRSPPNVRQNGQWPVDEWNQVIQSFPVPEFS